MKDEELFKAWKSEQYKDQSTEERFEFVEHLHTFPKYFKQAFLAGLKAGRPQWHKVKDGLPKESGKYLVCIGGVNDVFVIDFETEYNDFGYWCLEVASDSLGVTDTIFETITERNEDKVIAWCEIPTFDKE